MINSIYPLKRVMTTRVFVYDAKEMTLLLFEGTIHTSCHDALPPGMVIRSEVVEESPLPDYKWMTVVLPNGINRDVLVKDVKQVGEVNDKV